MDTTDFVSLLKESIFTVSVFSVFLIYAMAKGKYALINVIFALYLALLVSIKFPYFESITGAGGQSSAMTKIIIFVGFIIAGTMLFRRHIPGDDYEPAFHKLSTKILLALMATILVMAYSFHALPVTEILTPSTPIQHLFAPEQNFFWWLILPLATLFFV